MKRCMKRNFEMCNLKFEERHLEKKTEFIIFRRGGV
jgi:hypothetical protein